MAWTRYLLQSKRIDPTRMHDGITAMSFPLGSVEDAIQYARGKIEERHPDRAVELVSMNQMVTMFVVHAAYPVVYLMTRCEE